MNLVVSSLFGLIFDTCPAKCEIPFAGSENQSKKTYLCVSAVSKSSTDTTELLASVAEFIAGQV